jgi:dTDP-4-dehydrorhamnose 3,5-epimerase
VRRSVEGYAPRRDSIYDLKPVSIPDVKLRVTPDAPKDPPHRSPDGTLIDPGIEGVVVVRPPRHVDHRGSLFEAVSEGHDFWADPVVHCEWIVTSPGMIKGWGMHMESDDRYVVGTGRMRVVLFDGRVDSPTYERFAQFHFGDLSPGWLSIPRGVWHTIQNYGQTDAIILNFPTEGHRFHDPDKYRLDPYDRSKIDFDWTIRGG